MTKRTLPKVLTLLLIFSIGCAYSANVTKKNKKNMFELNMGMNKTEILKIMGDPDHHEAYADLNGHAYVFLYYFTKASHNYLDDGVHKKDDCTPIVIRDGKLIGWGDEFFEQVEKIEIRSTD